jgi:protocatechuate 3,4-dioxygenase alpha subunit
MTLPLSPSQTIGPFSHEAWRWACVASPADGAGITITGVIRDGDGNAIDDAMIEAWSAAAAPDEPAALLPGFRRVASDDAGAFSLTLPAPHPAGAGQPIALITVFARGLVLHQFSAIFLDDDPGLEEAALLSQVPPERRHTLIARKCGPAAYAWDIAMQGAQETVFFDYAGTP